MHARTIFIGLLWFTVAFVVSACLTRGCGA